MGIHNRLKKKLLIKRKHSGDNPLQFKAVVFHIEDNFVYYQFDNLLFEFK